VYFSAEDVKSAIIKVPTQGNCAKKYSFQVIVVGKDGFDVEPSEFAAESRELRDKWVAEFKKHHKRKKHTGQVVKELMVDDEVKRLGLDFRSSPPDPVFVEHVKPATWAAKFGVKPGDEVVELNNVKVATLDQEDFFGMLQVRPLKCGLVFAERRRDPEDGVESMTQEEFLKKYGDLAKWVQAESTSDRRKSLSVDARPKADRHRGDRSRSAQRHDGESEDETVVPLKSYDANRRSSTRSRHTKTHGKVKRPVSGGQRPAPAG